MRIDLRRAAALLAGLWAGVILCIAAIGAPASFAIAPRDVAGQVAGQMFAREAYVGLGVALILLMAIRRRTRDDVEAGAGSVMSANMLLVLGALCCTVLGYFAVQPMMAAAKVGQGALSFGALHGISAVFFVLKGLLILALAWRLSAA
jgi:hypothetical protein